MRKVLFFAGFMAFACSVFGEDLSRARELYQRTEYHEALNLLKTHGLNSPDSLSLAGKSAYMLGDFKRSAEYFEKAVQMNPQSSETFHWLGRAYGKRAETSSFFVAPKFAGECRKAFEKAVELDPKNIEAWNDLLEYYLDAPGFLGGGPDKASKAAQHIGELDPVEKHYAEARLAEKRKEYGTAEQHLRRASEMAPHQIGRLIDLAKFFAKQGRLQESELAFHKAQKISPDHPKLLFARAEVYIENKRNIDQAKQMLEKYLQSPNLTPDDPPKEAAHKLLRQAAGI